MIPLLKDRTRNPVFFMTQVFFSCGSTKCITKNGNIRLFEAMKCSSASRSWTNSVGKMSGIRCRRLLSFLTPSPLPPIFFCYPGVLVRSARLERNRLLHRLTLSKLWPTNNYIDVNFTQLLRDVFSKKNF